MAKISIWILINVGLSQPSEAVSWSRLLTRVTMPRTVWLTAGAAPVTFVTRWDLTFIICTNLHLIFCCSGSNWEGSHFADHIRIDIFNPSGFSIFCMALVDLSDLMQYVEVQKYCESCAMCHENKAKTLNTCFWEFWDYSAFDLWTKVDLYRILFLDH